MDGNVLSLHVAVGVLINSKNEILIAQRPHHTYKGDLWEFPGGKIEPNETVFEALQRELHEEMGVHIISAYPWLQAQYDYPDRKVLLDTWRITHFAGEPRGCENQAIQWILPSMLHQFQFPEGNRLILEKLTLELAK